jgi:hypothetical protein
MATLPIADWTWSTSSKGWTNNTLAIEWLTKVFFPSTAHLQGRRLLTIDGHGSHVQGDFIALCITHDIDLVILPSHSSHVTQPLDVSIFAPLKASLLKQAARYSDTDTGRARKHEWATSFQKARAEAMTKKNIITGWRATGIYPFAPTKLIPLVEAPVTPPRAPASTWILTPLGSLTFDQAGPSHGNLARLEIHESHSSLILGHLPANHS